MPRWTPDQLSHRIGWVLSVEYAGGTWYLSDESATVSDGVVGSIVLSDGLIGVDGAVKAIDLLSSASPRQSVSVEFDLGVNVAKLAEQGHDLGGAVCELAQLAEGDDWTQRHVWIRGRLEAPQYGGEGETIRGTISAAPLDDVTPLPVLTASVAELASKVAALPDYAVAPAARPAPESVTLPVVFGRPGLGQFGGSLGYYVGEFYSPAASTTIYRAYAIAGHACSLYSATLINMIQSQTAAVPPTRVHLIHMNDGTPVTVVTVERNSSGIFNDTTVLVRWDVLGGLDVTGVTPTVGSVAAYLLRLTQMTVDEQRTSEARGLLNGYQIDGYIDDPEATISEYITDVLGTVAPISLVVGADGVYPYVWQWEATAEDAVAAIDSDKDPAVQRDGYITLEDTNRVVNAITAQYAWEPDPNAGDGYYRRLALADGEPSELTDTSVNPALPSYWTDAALQRSRAVYGSRPLSQELASVWDNGTAARSVAWAGRRYALPGRIVRYLLPVSYAWIELGDLVTMTDSRIGWSAKLCTVQALTWVDEATIALELRVHDS